jgi:hypothetical protein
MVAMSGGTPIPAQIDAIVAEPGGWRAQIKDRKRLFNARLDSNSVRAIDFHEGDRVDEAALKALIVQAVRLNTSRVITR